MLSKTILFYVFVIVVFVLYWYITLQIYREQFLVEGPLTFLEDGDIIFLLTQNKYCYSDTLQLFLEGAFTSTLGLALGADTQKLIIDKIRGTDKTLDIYALDFIDEDGLKATTSNFNNTSNEFNSEIKISIVDYDKLDKSQRPIGGKYIINGDMVYLSINKPGETEFNTYLYTDELPTNPDDSVANLELKTGTITDLDGNTDKYKWRIQIDKEYSEDRFDSKIVDFACVVFTRKNTSNGSQINLRLGIDCKYGEQISEITDLLWDYVGDVANCGVTKVLDNTVGDVLPDGLDPIEIVLNPTAAIQGAYDYEWLKANANGEIQRCNTNDDCTENTEALCIGADSSSTELVGFCGPKPDNAIACTTDSDCNSDESCTITREEESFCIRDSRKIDQDKKDACEKTSLDNLIERIDSIGREREVIVSGTCGDCNHWQVRRKK